MWRLVKTLLVCVGLHLVSFPTHSEGTSRPAARSYFAPDGYRIAKYRAPTPDTVPHGVTVTTRRLLDLIRREDPVLMDVQAVAVRPETEEFGTSWLPARERFDLPGSIWLPNVGYGKLDKRTDDYFRYHLHRITGGDLDRAIVIYCVIDCWMSWNAIQRAASYGYRRLYWYPDGTDGWAARNLPMEKAQPVPMDSVSKKKDKGLSGNE